MEKERKKDWYKLVIPIIILYVGLQHFGAVLGFAGGIAGMFLPFALGSAIAFILNIPMKCMENEMKKLDQRTRDKSKHPKARERIRKTFRPLSLLLSVAAIVILFLVVILLVMPALLSAVDSVVRTAEKELPHLRRQLMDLFQNNEMVKNWLAGLNLDVSEIGRNVLRTLKDGADNIWSSTLSVTRGVVSGFVNGVIAFVFACYLLLSKEKLLVQARKLMYAVFPEKAADYIAHTGALSHRIFSSFVTGQCIEAVILGSMFLVSMILLKMPYALLVGILIAFTALIPMIGGFIGATIGAFLILLVSPVKAVEFLVLFQVLQQIEGNLIYPHVVGESVGLPSIWVLVAVTIGGSLMGVVGMLIFIPLVSVLYALLREWMYYRLEKKKVGSEKWN